MGIFKFLFSEQLNSGLSVTILVMHFNQVFCSIWQYFSQEENFFSRLSSLCFLNSDLHLACVCVGIMLQVLTQQWLASCLCLCYHNAAGNSILQLNLPQGISMSLCGQHLLLCIVLLSSAFSCLKAFWRSYSSVWIMSLRLIGLDPFDSLSIWRFLKFPFLLTSRSSADLDSSDVLTTPFASSQLCCAQYPTSAVTAAPPGHHRAAAMQQP